MNDSIKHITYIKRLCIYYITTQVSLTPFGGSSSMITVASLRVASSLPSSAPSSCAWASASAPAGRFDRPKMPGKLNANFFLCARSSALNVSLLRMRNVAVCWYAYVREIECVWVCLCVLLRLRRNTYELQGFIHPDKCMKKRYLHAIILDTRPESCTVLHLAKWTTLSATGCAIMRTQTIGRRSRRARRQISNDLTASVVVPVVFECVCVCVLFRSSNRHSGHGDHDVDRECTAKLCAMLGTPRDLLHSTRWRWLMLVQWFVFAHTHTRTGRR